MHAVFRGGLLSQRFETVKNISHCVNDNIFTMLPKARGAWAERGSHPRPLVFQTSALLTELSTSHSQLRSFFFGL